MKRLGSLRGIFSGRGHTVLPLVSIICIILPLRSLLRELQTQYYKPYFYAINNTKLLGATHPIMVNSEWLTRINFPSRDHLSLDGEDGSSLLSRLVFVTAASSNHFAESLDNVGSVQKYFPDHYIHYFDLGLSKDQQEQVKGWCNVIYRKFNFAAFPSHLGHLGVAAWKPVVIQEILSENPVVMWMDSSIRFWSSNISNILEAAMHNGGVCVTLSTGQSVWAATHPHTYRYLPTNQNLLAQTQMYGAGLVLILNTKKARENIIDWWILCSLDEKCVAPCYWFWCNRSRSRGQKAQPVPEFHEGCHRFDQSVLNVLLANWAQVTRASYVVPEWGWASSQRSETHQFKVNHCLT